MPAVSQVDVRPATNADAARIAVIHSSAWRAAFTFLPNRFLEAMSPDLVRGQSEHAIVESRTSMFVAVQPESVVGFLQVRADGDSGEVMSLYVDPSNWSQGAGSTLLAFGETWLVDRGVKSAVLWTARESQQSRDFYEHRGWHASGADQTQLLGPAGVALHEVEYRKPVA